MAKQMSRTPSLPSETMEKPLFSIKNRTSDCLGVDSNYIADDFENPSFSNEGDISFAKQASSSLKSISSTIQAS